MHEKGCTLYYKMTGCRLQYFPTEFYYSHREHVIFATEISLNYRVRNFIQPILVID